MQAGLFHQPSVFALCNFGQARRKWRGRDEKVVFARRGSLGAAGSPMGGLCHPLRRGRGTGGLQKGVRLDGDGSIRGAWVGIVPAGGAGGGLRGTSGPVLRGPVRGRRRRLCAGPIRDQNGGAAGGGPEGETRRACGLTQLHHPAHAGAQRSPIRLRRPLGPEGHPRSRGVGRRDGQHERVRRGGGLGNLRRPRGPQGQPRYGVLPQLHANQRKNARGPLGLCRRPRARHTRCGDDRGRGEQRLGRRGSELDDAADRAADHGREWYRLGLLDRGGSQLPGLSPSHASADEDRRAQPLSRILCGHSSEHSSVAAGSPLACLQDSGQHGPDGDRRGGGKRGAGGGQTRALYRL